MTTQSVDNLFVTDTFFLSLPMKMKVAREIVNFKQGFSNYSRPLSYDVWYFWTFN